MMDRRAGPLVREVAVGEGMSGSDRHPSAYCVGRVRRYGVDAAAISNRLALIRNYPSIQFGNAD
jgi:hypothetical protein